MVKIMTTDLLLILLPEWTTSSLQAAKMFLWLIFKCTSNKHTHYTEALDILIVIWTYIMNEEILLRRVCQTRDHPDSRLEDLSGRGAEDWKQTNLFLHARPMSLHARTHAHKQTHAGTQEGWVTRTRGIRWALMCWTDRNEKNAGRRDWRRQRRAGG